MEDSSTLPDLDVVAAEIVDDLQAALDEFAQIAADLKGKRPGESEGEFGRRFGKSNPLERSGSPCTRKSRKCRKPPKQACNANYMERFG